MNDASTALQDLEYFIHLTYQPHYDLNDEQMRDLIAQSFARVRARFRDFDLVLPEIQQLSMALYPNWTLMAPWEYLEALYTIVRNCSFTEAARNAAKDRAVLAWLERAMPASDQAQ